MWYVVIGYPTARIGYVQKLTHGKECYKMKKIVSLILALLIAFNFCFPVFAADNFEFEEEPITRAHDLEYKLVEVHREPEKRYYIGKAGGQPAGGYYLPEGSYLYWTSGGYSQTGNITLSWGLVSISTDVGSASSAGGSTGAMIPALANQACYLYVDKDLTIVQYEIYKRFAGTNGSWTSTGEYTTRVYGGTVYLRVGT